MSLLQDYIPEGKENGAANSKGKFMDYVPPQEVVVAPIVVSEPVVEVEVDHKTILLATKRPELEAVATDLGIESASDKKVFPNKTILVEAILAKEEAGKSEPVVEENAQLDVVLPETETLGEATAPVAALGESEIVVPEV